MSLPFTVPQWAVRLIIQMANATGLTGDVIACQANLESGFQTGVVSPAGAEGWLQFLPSTFASYGTGSPFNPQDAANAYINFMGALLRWSGGNVQMALAAYNAGQGNWQAGIGYANEILSCASGGNVVYNVKPPGGSKSSGNYLTPGVENDDWSYWVGKTADHFQSLADITEQYAIGLRRL